MAPEYGATMGFFPIDAECVNYLRATGRSEEHCRAYENYYQAQGLVGHSEERRHRLLAGTGTRPRHGAAERGRPETSAGPHRIAEAEGEVSSAAFSKPVTENGFGMKPEELGKTFFVSGNGQSGDGGGSQEPVSARRPVAKYQSADGNRNGQ